jgi:hypothetical protein
MNKKAKPTPKLTIRKLRRIVRNRISRYNKNIFKPVKERRLSVQIISAVTGEVLSARIIGSTTRKLAYDLALNWARNWAMDPIVESMRIPKNSTFYTLSDSIWLDYPVVLKVGTKKFPFLIGRVGVFKTGSIMVCQAYLKRADNLEYLQAVGVKRRVIKELFPIPPKTVKKRSKKKKYTDNYLDFHGV